MTLKHEHLPFTEGKVWRRKSDGMITTESLLGYTYYLGGKKLDEPHWETKDDYELIDAPEAETTEEGETIINEN